MPTLKIFLDASETTRAQRRFEENQKKGVPSPWKRRSQKSTSVIPATAKEPIPL